MAQGLGRYGEYVEQPRRHPGKRQSTTA